MQAKRPRVRVSGNVNTVLGLLAPDGVTIIETDDDNATFAASASSIAGDVIPADGTYYLSIRAGFLSQQIRGYDLYFRLQSVAPVPEAEPNNTPATAQPLPAVGHISGQLSSVSDTDLFSFNLNAGDTVVASLDLEPERDTVEWNGALSIGDLGGLFLPVNDVGAIGPDSESHHITVKNAGTYYAPVSPAWSPVARFGGYSPRPRLPATQSASDSACCSWRSPRASSPGALPAS